MKEYETLKELVLILEQFEDATDLCQGDSYPSISMIVPLIVGITKHLAEIRPKVHNLKQFVTQLDESLRQRFNGIFKRLDAQNYDDEKAESELSDLNFSDIKFMIAPLLDPYMKLEWVSEIPNKDDKEKDKLITNIKRAAATKIHELLPMTRLVIMQALLLLNLLSLM